MRTVIIRMLPDKSGRVRIHWFIHEERGPIKTPETVKMTQIGPVRLGGNRGRIACQPAKTDLVPQQKGRDIEPCCHSDDPRAVTCPECMAVPEYREAMDYLGELLTTSV
jgi:hypothetical protein